MEFFVILATLVTFGAVFHFSDRAVIAEVVSVKWWNYTSENLFGLHWGAVLFFKGLAFFDFLCLLRK